MEVLGAAQFAIEALAVFCKIYERIQGADEKIDHAARVIKNNEKLLRVYYSKQPAGLSPDKLKCVNEWIEMARTAAKEAVFILKLWEQAVHSNWLFRKAFQVGAHPERLEKLSEIIDDSINRYCRDYSGLAVGMTGPSNHTTIVPGVSPSGPTGISTSIGFQQAISHNQQQHPGSTYLGPQAIVPNRPSGLYNVSGNLNNLGPPLSSSAPPITSAPRGPSISGHAQPLNPLAHPFTMNSNVQLNNQQPPSSYSRPPLHHSSNTVPLVPPHQQQTTPSQNAPLPSTQPQEVRNSSSYPQPSAQPGVPSTQSVPLNGSKTLHSSGKLNVYATAQPPPSYGVPVPPVRVASYAPAQPAANRPSQGISHNSSNIPGQPQNYQVQPPRRPPHLGNPPAQPSYQPQAPHGTAQGTYVPPPPQRPQVYQNTHMQISNNAQSAAGCAQIFNKPLVLGPGNISAPGNRPQGLQQPQIQMANNTQQTSFAQSSNQQQVPRTGYVPPPPPAVKQSQGPQTTQFSNNARLGGSSAQPARQPQVPGAGHMSAPPVPRPPPAPQRMQLPNQISIVGNSTQSVHQMGVPHPTTQMPHAPVPTRTQVPQQNHFSNLAPSGQGPIRPSVTGPIRPPGQGSIRPQTSHSLPNSGIPGVSQHHTGPATYVSGNMPKIPNMSTQPSIRAQSNPTGWTGNTNQAPVHLSSAISGGTGVQHQNSFPGMPGIGLQPGFQ